MHRSVRVNKRWREAERQTRTTHTEREKKKREIMVKNEENKIDVFKKWALNS